MSVEKERKSRGKRVKERGGRERKRKGGKERERERKRESYLLWGIFKEMMTGMVASAMMRE